MHIGPEHDDLDLGVSRECKSITLYRFWRRNRGTRESSAGKARDPKFTHKTSPKDYVTGWQQPIFVSASGGEYYIHLEPVSAQHLLQQFVHHLRVGLCPASPSSFVNEEAEQRSLPALYCSTLSALSARGSQLHRTGVRRLLQPSRSTMASAPSPLSSIFSSTCLAMEPEMVPLPTSASSSAAASGEIRQPLAELVQRSEQLRSSQFAAASRHRLRFTFGFAADARSAFRTSAVSASAVSTPAL